MKEFEMSLHNDFVEDNLSIKGGCVSIVWALEMGKYISKFVWIGRGLV